jgi:hypothetical protein
LGKKKKQQGHYCRICGRFRANEKFGGKGHRNHICKDCNKDIQAQKRGKKRAKQIAAEAGLPEPKHHPMTRYQAASYLDITPSAFDYRWKKLELEPCGTYQDRQGAGFLFDIETVIAIHHFNQKEDQAK